MESITVKCPRCENHVFKLDALSRHDNTTHVCSSCGTDEAMRNWFGQDAWPGFPGPVERLH